MRIIVMDKNHEGEKFTVLKGICEKINLVKHPIFLLLKHSSFLYNA